MGFVREDKEQHFAGRELFLTEGVQAYKKEGLSLCRAWLGKQKSRVKAP